LLRWEAFRFDLRFLGLLFFRASDKCQREKRKTINGDDLLWAMATLGFEDYIEPLKVYLQKYREVRTDECWGWGLWVDHVWICVEMIKGEVVQSSIYYHVLDCGCD
jgi:nuclear transcription Y subunit beta